MDISFNCERMAEAINNLDSEKVTIKELARTIGDAFMDCMAQGHTYFNGSLDLNATEYMLQQIAKANSASGQSDSATTDKPRRKPGRKPKTVKPEKPAWTTEGKTHEQMLREKMAMMIEEQYGKVATPQEGKPRRKPGRKPGRKPKATA